jgi:polysaccharide pyruvyl transferase WcaK-like protein
MQILVDCCNYFLNNHNNGDIAIYQVFVKRIKHFWPNAEIDWITRDPDLIRKSIPEVKPLFLRQLHHWQLFEATHQPMMPCFQPTISRWMKLSLTDKVKKILVERHFQPTISGWVKNSFTERVKKIILECRFSPIDEAHDIDLFLRKLRNANIVVALGGGCFSDNFADHARGLLDTLAGGLAFGKTTALMCAGFETISNESLIAKAKSVIPHLQLITCREPSIGPKILSSFGVSNGQVHVTGDDAIELAYNLRTEQIGNALGINIRQTDYSGVDNKLIRLIRSAVQEAGRKFNAPLLCLPISVFGPSDIESVKKITLGYDGFVDAGKKLDNPKHVICQTGKCRIVITGSYHAAVCALAQGIPVVAIAYSLHYMTKFTGLAAQFQGGCTIVNSKRT